MPKMLKPVVLSESSPYITSIISLSPIVPSCYDTIYTYIHIGYVSALCAGFTVSHPVVYS